MQGIAAAVLEFDTTFSRFVPTVYFGLLTSLAMLVALLANTTPLPLLIVTFRMAGNPRGPRR